jgi:hypothetical protein
MPLDRPLPDDPREGLKMLWDVAQEQQVDIYRHRDSLHKVWHVAPAKPREGMLVYADGTDWNPGSGAGYYVYYAGAWHPLSGSGGGGGGITLVQDEGIALPVRTILNFIGAGVTATDDAGSSRTNVTITGGGGGGAVTSVFTRIGDVIAATGDYTAAQVTNAVSVLGSYADPAWITSLAYAKITGAPAAGVPTSRQVIAGTGMSGGGALTADVTLNALPMIASGASGRGGTVPTPGASAGTAKFLREDATWVAPPNTAQTPWLSHIDGAGFSLTNVGTLGVGTTSGGFAFRVKMGADQNVLLSPTGGTTAMQVTNDAVSAYVPMTYAALDHRFTTGNVGIGMAPAYQLQLSSDSAAKPTTSAWTIASDARVKRDVTDLVGGLDVIEKLRPIEATYNGMGGTPEGTRVVGFVAQEVLPVLPGAVDYKPGKLREEDPEETQLLGLNIHEIIIHMALAIKQLKAKVEALEAAAATP